MEPQVNPNAARKLRELIEDINIAMLTTHDADGRLRARPMGTTQVSDDGILWFFTSDEATKTDEIEHDPRVGLGYAGPNQDSYVSVSGRAELVTDRAKMEELWNPTLKAWFAQGLDTPDIGLLKVTAERAEYWDAPSGKMLVLFGLVKAALTGEDARDDAENKKLRLR